MGTVGNSALGPYISENRDFALEYYTGQEGYAAATWFHKRVGRGFTIPGTATEPFSALSVYGVTYDTLNPTQQAAINARGGPSVATVVLQEQVNASSALVLKGWELNWVQPLNFLLARYGVEGLGFSANYTHVNQIGQGTPPPVALNVPKDTWNLTLYYEHGPVSVHLSQVYNAAAQTAGFNQNGIPLAALYSNSYRQWDFSSSLDLGTLLHWRNSVQLTLDGINLANENQRAYFQFPNAAFTNYNAGRELLIGVRTKF